MKRIVLLFLVAWLAMLLACGCDTTGPSNEPIGLQIQPQNPIAVYNFPFQLTALLVFENGSVNDVTSETVWAVTPTNIAHVDTSGMFYPHYAGTCFLMGQYDIYSDTTVVQIGMIEQLLLEPSLVYLPPGQSWALNCNAQIQLVGNILDTLDFTHQVAYLSLNPEIAEVLPGGLVTGLAVGNASIMASIGTYYDQMSIHVAELDAVTIESPLGTVYSPTDTIQLYAYAHFDEVEQDITDQCAWQCQNPGVMNFDFEGNPGLVLVYAPGEANVLASYAGISSDPLTLFSKTLESIEISPADTTIDALTQIQYQAVGFYTDDSQSDLTNLAQWSSSDPDMVIISSGGMVTPIDSGSCTITAQKNGIVSNPGNLTISGQAIWFENFEYGLIHEWDEVGNWFIDEGQYVNQTIGGLESHSYNTDSEFTDFAMDLDFNHASGSMYYSCVILFRKSLDSEICYFIVVWATGDFRIGYRYGASPYDWYELYLGSSESLIQGLNVWNHIRIEAVESNISLYFNDEFAVTVSHSALTSGTVGFNSGSEGGYEFRFDDLQVTPMQESSLLCRNPVETVEKPGAGDPHILQPE